MTIKHDRRSVPPPVGTNRDRRGLRRDTTPVRRGSAAALFGRTTRNAEPKTLRYRLLHTAARIVRGQRIRKIKIPETWPWASQLAAYFTNAFALPPPT